MNKIIKPKSNYKGVYWDVRNNKWSVKLRHKGIIYLDSYAKDEKTAIIARDVMIIKHNLPIELQVLSPLKKD